MAELNLLKGKYDGKLGQTVGAKWKNKATVRSYTKAKDPKTQSQLKNRSKWKQILYVYKYTWQGFKPYTALDTSKYNLWCAFQHMNRHLMKEPGTPLARNVLIADGNLENPPKFRVYQESTNVIRVAIDEPNIEVDENTYLIMCAFDTSTKKQVSIALQEKQAIGVAIRGNNSDKWRVYLFWAKKVNGKWKNGRSVGQNGT